MNRIKTNIMKNIKSIVAIAFIAAFTVSLAKAEKFVGDPVRKSNAKVAQKAATCLPASSSSELNIIVGVDEDDFDTAVKAIYDAFVRD